MSALISPVTGRDAAPWAPAERGERTRRRAQALHHGFARLAAGDGAALETIRKTVAARRAILTASEVGLADPGPARRLASQLADETVVAAFSVAWARMADAECSAIPPLSLAAVGAYGRRALSPAARPTLLILVEGDFDRTPVALADAALDLLGSLGLPVDHAVPSLGPSWPQDSGLAIHLAGSRLLWGRADVYARACRIAR